MLNETNYTFVDYVDVLIKEKSQLSLKPATVFTLYSNYIHWLVKEKNKAQKNSLPEVTVSELLYQLQVITCYVNVHLRNNQSNAANTLVTVVPVSLRTPTDRSKDIKPIIAAHFKKIDKRVYDAVTLTSNESFESKFNWTARIWTLIGIIMIGAAFAPHISAGGAITMWVIGGLTLLWAKDVLDKGRYAVTLGHKPLSDFNGNPGIRDTKRKVILAAISPFKKVIMTHGEIDVFDVDSVAARTTSALKGALFPGISSDTTDLAEPSILLTVRAITENRFVPMYASENSKDREIALDNGNTQQIADLEKMAKFMSANKPSA